MLLTSCAGIGHDFKIETEVGDPLKAQLKRVIVLSDFYADDFEEADRISQLIRADLAARGFLVVESDFDADLVVIPTLIREGGVQDMNPPAISTVATAVQQRTLVRSLNLTNEMTQANSALERLGGVGVSNMQSSSPVGLGLMVIAVSRQEWLNTAFSEEASPVWRVTVSTYGSLRNRGDPRGLLVSAAGGQIEQIALGKVLVSDRSTNAVFGPSLPTP